MNPKRIIDIRERRLRRIIIQEYMVMWRGFPAEDSTWKRENILNRWFKFPLSHTCQLLVLVLKLL